MDPVDILVLGPWRPQAAARLRHTFATHPIATAAEVGGLATAARDAVRGIAGGPHAKIDGRLMQALPNLEIVANFGVGYDDVDVDAAAGAGVIVTNTPDVLTEEVADTAIGLLLMTVRELSAAERYLRSGVWAAEGPFRLSPTLRNRSVGIVGFGRIGAAVARRLDAMKVPVSYHNRRQRPDTAYPYYGDLTAMASDVDTLICILPGGRDTKHVIDTGVLAALGPDGVLINIGRGTTVDEAALIRALSDRTILAAGLDVYEHEPEIPGALLALDNAVLLPHVGSAAAYTRDAMEALVIDNLVSWFADGRPVTPVPETPWPRVS